MIGRPLISYDSVGSTQDAAFRLAALDAPEGTTVRTAHQDAGRGRSGRSWVTAPGDALLFSVLLRPPLPLHRLGPLSLLAGDAVADAVRELYSLDPMVKWPNDVLVDGRKLSGVLIQTRTQRLSEHVAVVGIGINVNGDSSTLPKDATSVRMAVGSRVQPEPLFRAVLAGLDRRYRDLQAGGSRPYIDRVNRHLWLKGQLVVIDDAGRSRTGRLIGVEDDGAVLIRTDDGDVRVVSGEMVRGPRMIG